MSQAVNLMRLIERLATYLDMFGIPTGRLCPGNLVADVCGYFVTADKLAERGLNIPGRSWSVRELRDTARAYIGVDLVSIVLAEEVRPGVTVEAYWTELADRLLEQAKTHPERYERFIDEMSANIVEAQRRLSGSDTS